MAGKATGPSAEVPGPSADVKYAPPTRGSQRGARLWVLGLDRCTRPLRWLTPLPRGRQVADRAHIPQGRRWPRNPAVEGGYDRRVRLKRKSATAAITTMMRMVHNMWGLRSLLVSSEGIRGSGGGFAYRPVVDATRLCFESRTDVTPCPAVGGLSGQTTAMPAGAWGTGGHLAGGHLAADPRPELRIASQRVGPGTHGTLLPSRDSTKQGDHESTEPVITLEDVAPEKAWPCSAGSSA